ncbi:hypothetical protein [Paraburkholderia bryophila]|nr:hypothetical protein [Paraburkholderia bryophila]
MKSVIFVIIASFSAAAMAGQGMSEFMVTGKNTVNVTGANGGHDGGQDPKREELSVSVVGPAGPITDAKCSLSNDKGDWSVTAPDTVTVRRSASALKIRCEKEGFAATEGAIEATTAKIEPKHFRFGTDAGGDGGDDDESSLITVPQYLPSLVITLHEKGAPQSTN